MTRRELFAAFLGAALTAAVFVARAEWGGADPAKKARPVASETVSAAVSAPPTHDDEAWRAANASLAETVKLTQRRLEQNEAEKVSLKTQLRQAQVKLAAAAGGAAPRNEFDLTQDDWKELAKVGTVKARYPCSHGPDWHLGADQAASLGLSPEDAATVEKVFSDEQAHIAAAIQPGCAKILGNADLAEKLGASVCEVVISQASRKSSTADAQLVSNIKAGNVAMPAADSLDPMATMMLVQAGAMERLQSGLGNAFGPEEGHRLAFADELGSCSSSWGGGPPKH